MLFTNLIEIVKAFNYSYRLLYFNIVAKELHYFLIKAAFAWLMIFLMSVNCKIHIFRIVLCYVHFVYIILYVNKLNKS